MAQQYEIYVKAGSPAVPGVDAAAATVAGAFTSAALSGLSYVPSTVHYLSVVAINDQGRATSWPTFVFLVDSLGRPLQTPSPVGGLWALALAGGMVRVGWTYDELVSLVLADHFEVVLSPQSPGLSAPGVVTVTHVAPRREYWVDVGPVSDGLWLATVLSVSTAGDEVQAVTGVYVRSDATAPGGVIAGLEAV